MFDRRAACSLILAGHCACPGCPGRLSDPRRSPNGWGHCRSCHCAWKVETYGAGESGIYPMTVPSSQGCPVWDEMANDPAHRWR
jgi:hypothetical protein